jgi:hypothetical protein
MHKIVVGLFINTFFFGGILVYILIYDTTKKDDVGKVFEEKIETFPTWGYPNDYQCVNEVSPPPSSSGDAPYTSYNAGVKCGSSDPPQAGIDTQTTSVTQGGNGFSSARALIPYNYATRPIITASPAISNTACAYPESIADDADAGCRGDDVPTDKKGWPNYGLVYGSENFTFNSSVIVNPRENPDVSDESYATYTKKTKSCPSPPQPKAQAPKVTTPELTRRARITPAVSQNQPVPTETALCWTKRAIKSTTETANWKAF